MSFGTRTMSVLSLRAPVRRVALGILLASTLAACSDNPVEDHHDEHAEVVGVVLRMDGVEVVRDWEGQMNGRLSVVAGEGAARVDVIFLDRDGAEVGADDLTEDFAFAFDPASDPTVARVTAEAPGVFAFRVEGLKAGTTTVKLGLKHGGEGGHYDFSRNVPIEVAAP